MKYLKDYKPAPYLVQEINLVIDIFDECTRVHSELKIEKKSLEKNFLELNGEGLKLISLKLNDQPLTSDDFQLSEDKLTITKELPTQFVLKIENEIQPSLNKALEGFYQSGDQLCTQCEPEGFRRITYYIDRPDNMAKFSVKMIGDKTKYPYLLSNGNRVDSGDLPDGRHFVSWVDPFKKPSYLFAMVAGDFDVARDHFITMSGRKIDLEIYVDKGNLHKTRHALNSLKESMKWDEEIYSLEYDLDLYMIVAVDSFNMGAMENKGLNIFNSTYTLADEQSATDADFQNIQAVIGHEYFHNWSGNRVTCRDWFQLTLKEGLTVYRDQEFSSDMLSRSVKRIEDAKHLKEFQFPEDAGPLSHPIRPESYLEINNFYTRTVYEKGAEIIRMIENLLGKEVFKTGLKKYFEMYDGQAVTTEDFIHAMELVSSKDLSQFKNWYSRPGTPKLVVRKEFSNKKLSLHIEQIYPPTLIKFSQSNVLMMPLKIAFVDPQSKKIKEEMLVLDKLKETFVFDFESDQVVSLNRSFSSPVEIDYPYSITELSFLAQFETDGYVKFDALQSLFQDKILHVYESKKRGETLTSLVSQDIKLAVSASLNDPDMDESFKAYLLEVPSLTTLVQKVDKPDFQMLKDSVDQFKSELGIEFSDWFLAKYKSLSEIKKFEISTRGYATRALKNRCLEFIFASKSPSSLEILFDHFDNATNMTDEIFSLGLIISTGVDLDHWTVEKFKKKWQHDSLVMLKWFSSLSLNTPEGLILERLQKLERHPLFKSEIPNYLRSLFVNFGKLNLTGFHGIDGAGYEYLARKIKQVDSFNPQVASRMASSFAIYDKLDDVRRDKMRVVLKDLMESNLSKDTYEVISKTLSFIG